MNNAYDFLVIILSIFLAIFLVMGIIVLYYAYKIEKSARNMTEKAEATINDAHEFVKSAKSTIAPAYAAKVLTQTVKNFTKKSKVKVKK
jgi:uncharacterized protein YpmB